MRSRSFNSTMAHISGMRLFPSEMTVVTSGAEDSTPSIGQMQLEPCLPLVIPLNRNRVLQLLCPPAGSICIFAQDHCTENLSIRCTLQQLGHVPPLGYEGVINISPESNRILFYENNNDRMVGSLVRTLRNTTLSDPTASLMRPGGHPDFNPDIGDP